MKMKNLPGIVKVRKTSFYTQVHSHPIQQDLEDLRSIGLLAYVQSMSEDFVLHKSFLYSKFSRRNVEAAIKELTAKNYWFSLKLHYQGQIIYAHYISDVIFSEEQIIEEVFSLEGAKFLGISTGYEGLEKQLHDLYNSKKDRQISVSSAVQFVQHNLCSTNCTSNYNKLNNNQLNNNQLKDIKDVNNVASVPISKDAERILSLKARWCKQGISPDWIEAIYQQSIERGIANNIAYVNKAASTYLDNMQKKSAPVSFGKTELVPEWFPARNHQKVEPEDKTIDFDSERQKILAKLSQSETL